jgi:hypothetical protein
MCSYDVVSNTCLPLGGGGSGSSGGGGSGGGGGGSGGGSARAGAPWEALSGGAALDVSQSIEEDMAYTQDFPSEESIGDEVPGVRAAVSGITADDSIADEVGGATAAAGRARGAGGGGGGAGAAAGAPPAPLSEYDAEAKLRAHEARITQLEELVVGAYTHPCFSFT